MESVHDIGMFFILGFQGESIDSAHPIVRDITERDLSGVILFGRCLHSPERPGNITSPAQLRALNAALCRLRAEPLLIGVDQEGGAVQRLCAGNGFSDYPSASQLGLLGIEATSREAAGCAQMLHEAGINCNFAPVTDVNYNPHNPIIGALERAFSSEPEAVADHAGAWIRAHRQCGVVSSAKHFPGHGSSSGDSHHGFVDISATWQPDELIPYQRLISVNEVDMVMTGHLFNRRLDAEHPATLSHRTITGLLREKLGFSGVVVSDDLQMGAITSRYCFGEAVWRALAAGVDLLIVGNNLVYQPDVLVEAQQAIAEALARGWLSRGRLDQARERIMGLRGVLAG
jgi:beta-N-acetylhexosaminidase